MTQTFSRHTLFALLSAMEEDLRDSISAHLTGQISNARALGDALYARAAERYVKDVGADANNAELQQLLDFTDFGDLTQILNRHSALVPDGVRSYVREITPRLDRLVPVRNRVMHSRPLDFDDLPLVTDTAHHFLGSSAIAWEALGRVTAAVAADPSVVLRYAIPIVRESSAVFNNLPLPDYDETGFIGRKKSVEQVIKACLGPYPVVTIVGEGGLGKTALALKVAYEILDHDKNPFDAIVWTTSKTTQLGIQEIRRIESAIDTSLGVLSAVSQQLAGELQADPVSDVLEQLRDFKILLVIDNLETVLDERIRSFLSELPHGSKVLITSRIGIGAFEVPVKLTGFEDSEAVQLLRALSKARSVEVLASARQDMLATLCRRMRNNPLHLKWFVSAVQAGRRPEDVLADDRLFLEFCMSDVYDYLTENSREVLDVLLTLGGQYSLAELSYLTRMESTDLQRAVQQLATTNMLVMATEHIASSYETRFELAGLARAYLTKRRQVPEPTVVALRKKKRQLIAAGDDIRLKSPLVLADTEGLQVRNRSDWVVARPLVEARRLCEARDFARAEELVQRAKDLAPDYFEVFRVEAELHAAQQNVTAAITAFEAAIELNPSSGALRTLFGRFLLRQVDDTVGAITQLERAVVLEGGVLAHLELARALLFNRSFERAEDLISPLEKRVDLEERDRKIVGDLRMQLHIRRAESAAGGGRPSDALADIDALRRVYAEISPDRRVRQKLEHAVPTARRLVADLRDHGSQQLALELLQWISNEVTTSGSGRVLAEGERHSGVIDSLPLKERYGFVSVDDGPRLFFHRSFLLNVDDWSQLSVGARLRFVVGSNDSGLCAISVERDTVTGASEAKQTELGVVVSGVVARLPLERSFGFLRADTGPEFFFHRAAVSPPDLWAKLKVSDRVRFRLAIDDVGRTRADFVGRE